jgi:hypothetical protein
MTLDREKDQPLRRVAKAISDATPVDWEAERRDHPAAVILRIEFGFGYQQIAEAVGSPSANAAQMTVSRALVRLAEALEEHWK